MQIIIITIFVHLLRDNINSSFINFLKKIQKQNKITFELTKFVIVSVITSAITI